MSKEAIDALRYFYEVTEREYRIANEQTDQALAVRDYRAADRHSSFARAMRFIRAKAVSYAREKHLVDLTEVASTALEAKP